MKPQNLSFESFLKKNKQAGMSHTYQKIRSPGRSFTIYMVVFKKLVHIYICQGLSREKKVKLGSSRDFQKHWKVKGISQKCLNIQTLTIMWSCFCPTWRYKRKKWWHQRDLVRYEAVKRGLYLKRLSSWKNDPKPISQLKTLETSFLSSIFLLGSLIG